MKYSFFNKKYWVPALVLLTMSPAYAADAPAPVAGFMSAPQIAKHQKTIDRLQTYLSKLTTIISDFTQVAPDGTLTNGKFYLERPGKMRWQYNPPTPILMVSNGSELVYYDYELEQINYIPLDSTLIGFMAQDKISFDKNVTVKDISVTTSAIRITLVQRDKPDDGQLMLEFSDKPLLLRNMVITDATKQMTTVSLNNARYGVDIDPKLFVFKDPRQPRHNH